jgi:hypothetical protein
VEGLLPIFEEVFDTDVRRKLQHKTQILDYVQFCDLHLPGRNTILRLCDRHYQFEQGLAIAQKNEEIQNQRSPLQTTTRKKWNDLLHFLNDQLPEKPVWSEFTAFAETGLDKIEMLGDFLSHINLSPQEETSWDKAFELYSGAVFLRGKPIS